MPKKLLLLHVLVRNRLAKIQNLAQKRIKVKQKAKIKTKQKAKQRVTKKVIISMPKANIKASTSTVKVNIKIIRKAIKWKKVKK